MINIPVPPIVDKPFIADYLEGEIVLQGVGIACSMTADATERSARRMLEAVRLSRK